MRSDMILDNEDDGGYEWTTVWNGYLSVPTRESIQRFITEKITHSDKSRLRERLFQVYIRETTIPIIQIALIALTILLLITWPSDLYYYTDYPKILEAYHYWRILSIPGFLSGIVLPYYFKFFRRNIYSILFVGVLGELALTGYLFGNVAERGLVTPWFYTVFVLPILTVFMSVKIGPRILATILVPVTYGGAYLFDNFGPHYWQYDFLGVIVNLTFSVVIVSILLGHVIYHLNRSNYFQERTLREQRQKIQELADHDQLTGLYTRREFENRFRDEFDRCKRYGSNISVMMVDLDHFKKINDTYGHPKGDEVLQTMGTLIEEQTRLSDIAGRYGGEEFCLVLPETDKKGARKMAERLREALAETGFESEEGNPFSVTCSIGIAEYHETIDDPEELLNEADEALYRAKEEGRNRVIIA